jgi:nucleoside-diphosphate-sugar epimerase
MKTALLAGGAGFIGSNLCDLLLSKDYNVIVVDSLVTGRKSNLTQALKSGRVEWVEADIRSRESLNSALRPALNRWGKLDEVYELASPASPVDFAKMPLFILETAALGLRNILDLAHEQVQYTY